MPPKSDSETLKEALECSVCRELFNEPKQLKCGHTYCNGCVNNLERVSQQHHSDEEANEYAFMLHLSRSSTQNRTSVHCPQCRCLCPIPQNGLSTNYALKEMVEKFREAELSNAAESDECSQPETAIRLECESCTKKVPEAEMFFCKSCKEKHGKKLLICSMCVIKHHRKHNVVMNSELAGSKEREEAVIHIDTICSQINELIRNQIHSEYQQPLQQIQERFKQKLDNFQLLQLECYDSDENPLKTDIEKKVQEAGSFAQQLAKISTAVDKASRDYAQQLKQIESQLDDIAENAVSSPDLLDLNSQPGPSSSPLKSSPQHNHFAYTGENEAQKLKTARRIAQRRRPHRLVTSPGAREVPTKFWSIEMQSLQE